VTIAGSSYSQDGVARLLARLGVVPALTHVQLQTSGIQTSTTAGDSSTDGSDAGTGIVTFTITADIASPGAVS
jgi:hypothetical protein